MEYYKIVSFSKNKYYSFNINNSPKQDNIFCIEYIVGHWTYPVLPELKLYAFSDLKECLDVHKYCFFRSSCRIFTCKLLNPCNDYKYNNRFLNVSYTLEQIQKELKLISLKDVGSPLYNSEIYADSIKITQDITNEV